MTTRDLTTAGRRRLSFESFPNPEHTMSAGFIPKHDGYK